MNLVASVLPRPGSLMQGFAALRHRNYRLYWSGQVVSLVGTWMGTVTLPWLVLQLGASPLVLAIVIALQFIPALLLAPFGGVLADRIDKRRALIGTQFLAMVHAVILFALTFTGVVEIWHVVVLSAALGCVNAADMPLRQSFTAELVPKDELTQAIALNATSFNLARFLGPAVAGVSISTIGIAFNFGVNALSYLAVLVGLLLLDSSQMRRVTQPEHQPRVLSSLAEGIGFAWRTPLVLWPLILLGGVATFGFNFQVLLPLFARNDLGLGADGYGALFAAMGIGSLGGSLFLAFAGRRPRLRFMIGGGLVFLTAEVLVGVNPSVVLAYPLMTLVGFFSILMINTINATIQWNVTPELRGRVMSLFVTVFAGTVPFGNLFAGSIAEAWGSRAGFVAGAVISGVVLAVAAWRLRGRVLAVQPVASEEGGDPHSEVGAAPRAAPAPATVSAAGLGTPAPPLA